MALLLGCHLEQCCRYVFLPLLERRPITGVKYLFVGKSWEYDPERALLQSLQILRQIPEERVVEHLSRVLSYGADTDKIEREKTFVGNDCSLLVVGGSTALTRLSSELPTCGHYFSDRRKCQVLGFLPLSNLQNFQLQYYRLT